jgi:hypothetical protein
VLEFVVEHQQTQSAPASGFVVLSEPIIGAPLVIYVDNEPHLIELGLVRGVKVDGISYNWTAHVLADRSAGFDD